MNKIQSFIVVHYGARLHYAVAISLQKSGQLACLITDWHLSKATNWAKSVTRFFPTAFNRSLGRTSGLPCEKVRSLKFLGILYSIALARGNASKVYWKYNKLLNRIALRHSQKINFTSAYLFNGCALELLQGFQNKGIRTVLEFMIAPVAEINQQLQQELSKYAAWTTSNDVLWDKSWIEREKREAELADIILAPSPYVRDALIATGVAPHKIRLVPYGVDNNKSNNRIRKLEADRQLNVLFCGTFGLRKGAPYIIEAAQLLPKQEARIRVVGKIEIRNEYLGSNIDYVGHVPRADVHKHYEWADCIILPSLCEGSATVCYEALLRGIPVIATPNVGLPEEAASAAILIQPRSALAIRNAILQLRGCDSLELRSKAAVALGPFLTREAYSARLLAAIS